MIKMIKEENHFRRAPEQAQLICKCIILLLLYYFLEMELTLH